MRTLEGAPPRARPGAAIPASAAGGRINTPPPPIPLPRPRGARTRAHVSARPAPPQGRRSERAGTPYPSPELGGGGSSPNCPRGPSPQGIPLPPSRSSPARWAGGGNHDQDWAGGRGTSCRPLPSSSRARAAPLPRAARGAGSAQAHTLSPPKPEPEPAPRRGGDRPRGCGETARRYPRSRRRRGEEGPGLGRAAPS